MNWKMIPLLMAVVGSNVAHARSAAPPSAAPAELESPCVRRATGLSQGRSPDFMWPVQGELSSPPGGDRGIDIAGDVGAPVKAAADGVVVYAGSDLRGYGRLIIVRHDDVFLTAYANNRTMLVKEGDKVHKGQVIAELGRSGDGDARLHFEIRRGGYAVDPLIYLPARTTS
jgi:lipoprotein NlpD